MRLLKFLSESENLTLDDIWKDCQPFLKLLGVNSLDKLKSGKFDKVYRGVDWAPSDKITKQQVKPRKPIGTHHGFFPIFNTWFKSNGFVPRDKAVFGTSFKLGANQFGSPFVLFPIGQCKYTYVTADDFNNLHYASGDGWDGYGFMWLLRNSLTKFDYWIHCDDNLDEDDSRKVINRIENMSPEEEDEVTVTIYPFNEVLGNQPDSDEIANWYWRADQIKGKQICNKDIQKALKNEYEIWFECNSYYLVPVNIID